MILGSLVRSVREDVSRNHSRPQRLRTPVNALCRKEGVHARGKPAKRMVRRVKQGRAAT